MFHREGEEMLETEWVRHTCHLLAHARFATYGPSMQHMQRFEFIVLVPTLDIKGRNFVCFQGKVP